MPDASVLLSLSVKGLQRLEAVSHEADFAFIIGGERYECASILAEFLSPRVISLRSQDQTVQELALQTDDPNHSFDTLLSLAFGREVSVAKTELPAVRSLCLELWNYELFEMTFKHEEGPITKEELKARLDFLAGVDASRDRDVFLVASHFYELSIADLDRLSPSVLEAILSDSTLVLQDEDSLFE
jgi:hypothetical protein